MIDYSCRSSREHGTKDPSLSVALVSKVYPMRSHTVAAEGGSAAVTQSHDSLEAHFHDTVAGGDWLCEQDVVDYFVANAHEEMVQMEHWGYPWSRRHARRTFWHSGGLAAKLLCYGTALVITLICAYSLIAIGF